MKIRYLLILLFVIFFFIILFFFFYRPLSTQQGELLSDSESWDSEAWSQYFSTIKCKFIPDQEKREVCRCENSVTPERRDGCYSWTANFYKNENYCFKVIDKNRYDGCFLSVATLTQKPEICENMIDQYYKEDSCYKAVASFKHPKICLKIKDLHTRDGCYMKMILNPEYCIIFNSDPDVVEACDYNATLCENIQSSSDKDQCYSTIAQRTNNNELCQKIKYIFTREVCELNLYDGKDISFCENLVDQQSVAICYQRYAVINKYPETCDKISSEPQYAGIKESCLRDSK